MNARNICLIYGVVFILIGILGFISNPIISAIGFFQTNTIHIGLGCAFIVGNLMLGIIHLNDTDHWLHLGLGLAVLGSGFIFPNRTAERLYSLSIKR
ncbi:hypothetical protein [Methylotuvimicrobium sp. KM1]|uniref:hypothetical protein n=1 Tax=Methylotuvimicrobium sp. KM1 TaxID=3377707 RepID=UPI00384B74C8